MYQAIDKQKPVVVKYGEQLISSGIVTQEEFEVRLYTVVAIDWYI